MSSLTLVLPARCTPDSVALERAARRIGWRVERVRNWATIESLRGSAVAVHQEIVIARTVAEALGIALLAAPADWLVRLPEDLRRRALGATTVGGLRRHTFPLFVKDATQKRIPARVYRSHREVAREEGATPELVVLTSEPVAWAIELRTFVLEGEMVALSPYMREGQLPVEGDEPWFATTEELEEARAFAREVLSDARVRLPPAVVLDIGRIPDRGWAVVEANPVWSSGLAGCEAERILPVLRRACVPADGVPEHDRPWVLDA